jgi:hypothetical protein
MHSGELFCGELTKRDTSKKSSADSGYGFKKSDNSVLLVFRGSSHIFLFSGGMITGIRSWSSFKRVFASVVMMVKVFRGFPSGSFQVSQRPARLKGVWDR